MRPLLLDGAEEDPVIHIGGVAHDADVGGGGDAGHSLAYQHVAKILERRRRAAGGAIGDANLAAAEDRVFEQPGLGQRHFGGTGGHQRYAAHRAGFLAVVVGRGFKIGNCTTEAGVELGITVPLVHPANAAGVIAQPCGKGRPVVAEGSDGRHAGNYNALGHQNIPPFTEIT